jgi:hypothetical protein
VSSLSGAAAELPVVHGGELEVVVRRGRHVEVDGPGAVAAPDRRRRGRRAGGRQVRALVAAQGLPGLEHAEAERALVDHRRGGLGAVGLGRRRRGGRCRRRRHRQASTLAFLDAGAVAAQRLVRPEHLPARAALVPAARPRDVVILVVLGLVRAAAVVLLSLRARRAPVVLGPGSGPRPRVPGQHHERHGHVLLRRGVGDAARRLLGIRRRRRRATARPLRAPAAHGEPRGRLCVALAVLHDRRLAAGRPAAGEFGGADPEPSLGAAAQTARRQRPALRRLAVHLGRRGRRQGERRRRARCRHRGGHDVGAHVAAQRAAIVEPPEAELAGVPVHRHRASKDPCCAARRPTEQDQHSTEQALQCSRSERAAAACFLWPPPSLARFLPLLAPCWLWASRITIL